MCIVGLNREKLLDLKDLTIHEVTRVTWAHESAQCAIKSMSKTFEVSVSNRLSTSNKRWMDGNDKIFVKGRAPQEQRQWLQKKACV